MRGGFGSSAAASGLFGVIGLLGPGELAVVDVNGTTAKLIGRLWDADAEVAVTAIEELGRRRELAAAPELLALLQASVDGQVRGAAALALAQMRSPAAFATIVRLLREPTTTVDRVTLLRALEPYDCSSILCLLVDFAVNGSFEVSRIAARLIGGIRGEVDPEQWRRALTTLRAAYDNADPADREELIGPLLELVE